MALSFEVYCKDAGFSPPTRSASIRVAEARPGKHDRSICGATQPPPHRPFSSTTLDWKAATKLLSGSVIGLFINTFLCPTFVGRGG